MFTKFFFTKRLFLFFLILSSCFYSGTTELFAQQSNNKKAQKSEVLKFMEQLLKMGDLQTSEAEKLAGQFVSKYGEANCKALFIDKQLRVGMPFELFNLGYEEGWFSRFNYSTMSMDYGDGHFCLNLFKVGADLREVQIGFVWFTKYKISSIHYY